MTLPGATPPPVRHEVEHLFGQCLLRFQAFELLMKAIVATHRISGSIAMLEDAQTRQITETRRKTMGVLVGDMMGPVLAPEGQEGLPDADEEVSGSSFAFSLQLVFPSEDFARIEAEHRALVELRNSLVHHFLQEHDLGSEASCLLARQALTSALDRVTLAYDELRSWAAEMELAREAMANHLASPELRDWMVKGRIPWPATKITQALMDASKELASDGWASVKAATEWVTAHHPDERPEGYATRLMQPRAVVLHGKTAENGKSQILELARGLLPASAICSVPASKMGDERHVIGLVGKLLNASDELSPEAIASDTFKAVVTGDPIEGRDVYKSRVEFRSVAQNLFAANQLPSFKGGVDRGVQRRLLLIPFTRSIPLEERIEDIGKRIAAEEPDLLLAWAVDGAARLIRQRNFAIPQGCHDALLEWVLSEDPIAAWIDACVRVAPIVNGGPMLATRDAHLRFQNWALAEGYKTEKLPAINGFVQRVQARVAGIQHKRTKEGRFFIGLTVTHW